MSGHSSAAWTLGPYAAIAVIITGLAIAGRWYDRHHQPRDPIDALATAVTCLRCRPSGLGACKCSTDCGHIGCYWSPGHSTQATWTDVDFIWAEKHNFTLPEGSGK